MMSIRKATQNFSQGLIFHYYSHPLVHWIVIHKDTQLKHTNIPEEDNPISCYAAWPFIDDVYIRLHFIVAALWEGIQVVVRYK